MRKRNYSKQFIKVLSILFVVVSFFSIYKFNAKAAVDGQFKMAVPNGGALIQGCTYGADIRVNAGSNQSNAADVIVTFDPSKIEIIDSIPSLAGTQIKTGVAYETYPSNGNVVDQTNGIIRLSGVSLSTNFTGEDIFGTIQFRSKPGATNGAFNITFTGAGATLDSNIAEYSTSTDVLSSVTNASMTFTAGACVSDTVPPNVNFVTPINNQSNVPANSNITINLTDSLSGVNISTLELFVNGVLYTSASPQLTVTGSPSSYNLSLDPSDPFYTNAPSNIVVRVRDLAGNLRQSTISFNYPPGPTPTAAPTPTPTTPDLQAPSIEFVNPIANETIGNSESLVVILRDVGSGINLNNLVLFVNDKKYTINDSTVFSTGNPNEYTITITDNFNYSKVSSSYFSVFVTDLASNPASGNIIFNIPPNVINEDNKTCPTSSPNKPVACPTVQAPLSSQVNDVQQNVVESLPDQLKPLVSEGGFLGLASVVALLPLGIQLLITLGSLLLGGFLWPLLYALIIPANKKIGKVIDDFTKEGIPFARITVFEKMTGTTVRKATTDFGGKFFLHLDPGVYIFKLEKRGYNVTQVEATISQSKDIDFLLEMTQVESSDLGERLQFNVFKLDIKLLFSYFALLLAAINLIYIRGLFALIIFLVVFVIAGFLSYRAFVNKKFARPSP